MMEKIKKFNQKKLGQLNAFLLVISPIAGIYKFGAVNVSTGDVIFVLLVMIYVCFATKVFRPKTGFPYYLMLFFVISFVIILFQRAGYWGDFVKKWFKLVIYYMAVEVAANVGFDIKFARRLFVNIAVLISILLIIQGFLHIFLGTHIYPYLSYPNLYYTLDLIDLKAQWENWINDGIWRPSSIFLEPADYAQYCLLPLAFLFFGCNGNSISVWAKRIIIILGILFSGSSIGILIMVLIGGIWLYSQNIRRLKRLDALALLCLLPIALILVTQSSFFSSAIARVKTLSLGGGRTTANLRFIQGLYIYQQLPAVNKIIGIGVGNLRFFLITNSIQSPYLAEIGNEYMNAFSTILVSTGIIGLLFYLMIWRAVWLKCSTSEQKILMIVLTILFFTSSIFYNNILVVYLSFICRNHNNIENYNLRVRNN